MKINAFKLVIAIFSLGSFVFVSCEKDGDHPHEEVDVSSENSARAAKMDNVAEGTLNIIEQAFAENETGGRGTAVLSLFTPCTEITVGMQGNVVTILLDFGDSCTLNNGNVVSGGILLEYGPLVGGTYTVNYTFQ